MNKPKVALCIAAAILFFAVAVLARSMSLIVDKWWNNKVDFAMQKVDDSTNYETIKKVEDTCRAMRASYETDKLTYEQYKGSDEKEKRNWGEQAKMRANKTANTYNEYILQNSFVWKGNIPSDVKSKLDIVN